MNESFRLHRFLKLLQNDLLDGLRPRLFGAMALIGIIAVIYVSNMEPGHTSGDPPIATIFFGICLIGGGVVLTSMAFGDMHHPLLRYHYLLLPVSNLERFLSRWLITGPLFVLYALLAFGIADAIGNLLARAIKDASEPLFAPFSAETWVLVRIYLFVHALALTGAICFRSLALLKSMLTLIAWSAATGASFYLALRIFYFDAFRGLHMHAEESIYLPLMPLFSASWMNWLAGIAATAWILYVAFRCLKAHEVQDEL